MSSTAVIVVENLSKTYHLGKVDVPALKNVDLTIDRGDFVAVMGPSGSGKSTFLNLLGCLDTPTAGTYRLNDVDVSGMSDDELADIRGMNIGFVFQGYNLLSRVTAFHNVELPLYYSGRNQRNGQNNGAAESLMKIVGLPDRGGHKPSELSGGEQQRVAIARSLVNSPYLILADEPTGNLDTQRGQEIMQLLAQLNKAGITILLVTHEQEIAAYAKRLVRFRDGEIISDEPNSAHVEALAEPSEEIRDAIKPSPEKSERSSILSPKELLENVIVSFRSLWQNRLRAVLTILGILIGVAAVIAMVSIGQGAQSNIESSIQSLGSNLLTVIPGSSSSGRAMMGFGSAQTLTYDDAIAIRDMDLVAGIAPEVSNRLQIKYGRDNWQTNVVGTTADYPLVRNWDVAEGRFFSEEENRLRKNVAVIGTDIKEALFAEEDPIGKRIKIGGISFTVIGILEERGGGGFMSQDDTILVPIQTAYKRYSRTETVRSIGVSVINKGDMTEAQYQITELIRNRHKILNPEDDDFMIYSQEDVMQTMQGVTSTFTMLLASIAGISLLVGGIGIMNIMLVSVTERTREIGIRKAIGARRRDILAQFLTEAVILSGSGGLLGWGFGALAAHFISTFGDISVQVSFVTVGLALGFSIAVGIFFGIYPAHKASRMDPIQALRYE